MLAVCVAALASTTRAPAKPIWLTRPACSSEEALAIAAPLQMIPPRRREATEVDAAGRSTDGRCLPYALLLQLRRLRGADVPDGSDLRTIDAFRNEILNFAVAEHTAPWRTDSEYATLGDVVAAVMENRGWFPTAPRAVAVRAWAARNRGRVPCDAAFLFAAAAKFGVRVHVHYRTKAGLMADTQFAAPATAPAAMQPRSDVHLGYCESGDDLNHYVSLPAVWER